MKKFSVLIIIYFLSAAGWAQTQAEKQEQFEEARKETLDYYSQFDGIWEGTLSSHELDGRFPEDPFQYKILLKINGEKVAVSHYHEGNWYKSGYNYNITRHGTNAVIFAHESETAWVETFNFTVTLDSIDELRVLWNRAVSNYMAQEKTQEARGYFQGSAVFSRYEHNK